MDECFQETLTTLKNISLELQEKGPQYFDNNNEFTPRLKQEIEEVLALKFKSGKAAALKTQATVETQNTKRRRDFRKTMVRTTNLLNQSVC